MKTVLITDYAWPSLDIEREILAAAGAELLAAKSGDEAELVQLAPQADAILTNWKKVSPAVVRAATRCLHIGRYGIGLDNIAVDVATECGIVVTNVPTYCVEDVAEHTIALVLTLARKTAFYDAAVKAGRWQIQEGWALRRVAGRTLGLIGFGKIAQAVAKRAAGLGLRVVAVSPHLDAAIAQAHGVTVVALETLLRESDFVSLHCPLTGATRGLLNEARLRQMKPSSFLINTSRGAVIETAALRRALGEGWIAGAGLDVMPQEPPDFSEPLLKFSNCVVTPHAAFYSEESIRELQTTAARQVADALSGRRPPHIVNPQVLNSPALRLKSKPAN